jgi:hypothetical protein
MNYFVTFKNKKVNIQQIAKTIKIGDSITSSTLGMTEFMTILDYINRVQQQKYKSTIFGDPLVMVFC